MMHPGSLDNGETDVEYSPHICAQDERFAAQDKRIEILTRTTDADRTVNYSRWEKSLELLRKVEAENRTQDKRISSLERQVHRMLNPEPHSDEWQLMPEYLQGYTDGRAAVTKTEGDYVHIPGAIWEDMIDELAAARSTRADMDERGVLLSHDAYDMLERQAAIGRSVPWAVLNNVIWQQVACADYIVLRTWLTAHELKESTE